MIFLLDILLGINLLWAYKSFKNILSPPILVGAGMFIASLVATLYYKEWEMNKTCYETVLYLGGGTLFFTLSCQLFKKRWVFSNSSRYLELKTYSFNMERIKILLLFLIGLGVLTCYLKIREYGSYYGNLMSISELLYYKRSDDFEDSNFKLPKYVVFFSFLLNLFTFIVSWILSILLLTPQKNKQIIGLCIGTIVITTINGLFTGNKAAALSPLTSFGTIFFFLYSFSKRSFSLNIAAFKRILFLSLIFYLSFDFFNNTLLGRNATDKKSSLISIYIGAEIKNFDIYIQEKNTHTESPYFGVHTFKSTYQNIDNHLKNKIENIYIFQCVGNYELGNVCTQFHPFHKDFGGLGVFIMTFIVASFTMLFYNKALNTLKNPHKQNVFLYMYSMMTMSIFMTFFSSRVTEQLSKFFLYYFFALIVVIIFFDKVFRIKNV